MISPAEHTPDGGKESLPQGSEQSPDIQERLKALGNRVSKKARKIGAEMAQDFTMLGKGFTTELPATLSALLTPAEAQAAVPENVKKETIGNLFYPMFQTEVENMTTRAFGPGEIYYDPNQDPSALYVVVDFKESDLPLDLAHTKHEPLKRQRRLNHVVSQAPQKARRMISQRWTAARWRNDWDKKPAPSAEVIRFAEPIYANEEKTREGLRVFVRVLLPKSSEHEQRVSGQFDFAAGQMKNQTLYPREANGRPKTLDIVLKGHPDIEVLIIENYDLLRYQDFQTFLNKFQKSQGGFITIEQVLAKLSPRFAELARKQIPFTNWKPLRPLGKTEAAKKIIEADKDNMAPEAIWTKEKYYGKIAEIVEATLEAGSFIAYDQAQKKSTAIKISRPALIFEKLTLTDNGQTYRWRITHFYHMLERLLREYKKDPAYILNQGNWEKDLSKKVARVSVLANNLPEGTPIRDAGKEIGEVIGKVVDSTIDKSERVGAGLRDAVISIINAIKN